MRDYAKVPRDSGWEKRGENLERRVQKRSCCFLPDDIPSRKYVGFVLLPVLYLAHETGLGPEGASKGLKGLLKLVFVAMTMMPRWSGP